MRNRLATLALAATVVLAGCDKFGRAMTAHTDVVARAAGHVLTVNQAASMIARNPRLPQQPQVVGALANIWTNYTLLATAMEQDSTLKQLNLDAVVRPEAEQAMVFKLRDKVIHPDTVIPDSTLRALYEKEQPDVQLKASHILIRVNSNASPATRDSALALARQIDQKAKKSGADFAALAKKYSQDPGSAKNGGELGWFGRGQMVAPFEDAAYKLKVGEVSDVVETPFGYHIIKLEGKKVPKFEDNKVKFRQQVIRQRTQQAEQKYVQDLTKPLNITMQPGAYDVVRELVKEPDQTLGERAGGRALVKYTGGAYTAQDFVDFMQRLVPTQRSRYASATNEQLQQMLRSLTVQQILLAEAAKQGLSVNKTQMDSLSNELRARLGEAAKGAGLTGITPQQGETKLQALDRKVDESIGAVVMGRAQMLPLGPIGYAMRKQYGGQVFDRTFPDVITKVKAIEAEAPAGSTTVTPSNAAPAKPDTSGGSH